jgi:hypothetical protein
MMTNWLMAVAKVMRGQNSILMESDGSALIQQIAVAQMNDTSESAVEWMPKTPR